MTSTISLDFFTPLPCVHNICVLLVRKFWLFEIFPTPNRFCVEVIYHMVAPFYVISLTRIV